MPSNHRLIQALLCQPVDRTPVWIMRQAGRYLPEYRAIRKKANNFLTLCKTPELASIVTLQPIQRFPLDAAILFSDILTIPDAYGLGLQFKEGEGPIFSNPIQTIHDIQKLPKIDPNTDLQYVMDTIRLVKQELQGKVPLIGFAGSPWTIATYMVEGGSSKHFYLIKRLRYENKQALHQLCLHLSESIIDYLNAQIQAGADVVMLFDTWGGILSPEDYLEFSLYYIKYIIDRLIKVNNQIPIPIIVFSKNGGQHLEQMSETGCHAIGIDWLTNIQEAKEKIKANIAIQGNLDPTVLYGSPTTIQENVQKILTQINGRLGHVFNLGHGIPYDVDPEKVAMMIEAVHNLSEPFHSKSYHSKRDCQHEL